MSLFRHNDRIVYFCHIPKTGGTSINDAILAAGVKRCLHYGSRFDGFSKSTLQHIHADIHKCIVPESFYDDSFAIIRHPFARLVSEYFYRRKRGYAKRKFNYWVNAALDKYETNPYIFDNHLRPQTEFLTKSMKVYKLEDGLQAPLQAISKSLGIQLPKQDWHTNKTKQRNPVVWTTETKKRAFDFFKVDFKTGNYDIDACSNKFDERVEL